MSLQSNDPNQILVPTDQADPAIPSKIQSPLGRDNGPGDLTVSESTQAGLEREASPATLPQGEVSPPAAAPAVDPTQPLQSGPEQPQGDSHLSDKAAAYDFIMNDPGLRSAVENQVSLRLGEVPEQPSAPAADAPAGESHVTRAEYDALKARMNSMAVDNANRAVAEMRQQYSDFQSLEDQIGTIVRASPKLTLTQAYHLAKIEQNGGQPAVAPRQAAPQPTESGPGGGGARSSETPDPIARAQEAMKRLPPGNNQLEDSIRLAWDAALEKHGSQ